MTGAKKRLALLVRGRGRLARRSSPPPTKRAPRTSTKRSSEEVARTLDRPPQPIAREVKGLAGCSADASRVYLASEEALIGEGGGEQRRRRSRPGSPTSTSTSAERRKGGRFAFVATLASRRRRAAHDPTRPAPQCASAPPASPPTARHLAFMSAALADAAMTTPTRAAGEADTEVYLYDAAARAACSAPPATRPGRGRGRLRHRTTARQAHTGPPPGSRSGRTPSTPRGCSPTTAGACSSTPPTRSPARHQRRRRRLPVGGGGRGRLHRQPGRLLRPQTAAASSLISSGQSGRRLRIPSTPTPAGEDVFFTTLSSLCPTTPA